METSFVTRVQRPELARTDSSGGASRGENGDKEKNDNRGIQPGPTAQRNVRYKEKFQSLRDKYEHVISTHEKYERELAIANRKIKDLQNECNLLLDAVDIAVPGQPTLQHYLNYDPVPPYMASAPSTYMVSTTATPVPHPPPPPLPREPSPPPSQPSVPSRSHSGTDVPHTNGLNGH